ncbi:MAG: hypothetical protein JWN48_4928 [Myxococcaceae bacterium]|nr:hypothetical protein [Myxococcaceae bacterium]
MSTNSGTKRELLERLIVSELVSRRGEGALARKHFARVPRMLASAAPENEVTSKSPVRVQPAVPVTAADEPEDPA